VCGCSLVVVVDEKTGRVELDEYGQERLTLTWAHLRSTTTVVCMDSINIDSTTYSTSPILSLPHPPTHHARTRARIRPSLAYKIQRSTRPLHRPSPGLLLHGLLLSPRAIPLPPPRPLHLPALLPRFPPEIPNVARGCPSCIVDRKSGQWRCETSYFR
jgi:hypothetical protein